MPISVKKIRNKRYIYFVRYDHNKGKQKHICCGIESNPEAKTKAIKLEIRLLDSQSSQVKKEKKRLEDELHKTHSMSGRV